MTMIDLLRSAAVFAAALAGYLFIAGDLVNHPSIAPYFINLGEAFQRGRVDIAMEATSQFDLIYYNQRWFVAQPPLPAMLLAPFLSPDDRPSDVMLGVILGALNVMLCERVLRRVVPDLRGWRALALTAFFGFGTAHFYLATLGTVWFLGQVSAVLALWLFLAVQAAQRPLAAGAALGLALLARPTMVPGALAFDFLRWWQEDRPSLRRLWLVWLPIALAAGFQGAYNAARFGDPLDFGYQHINDSSNIRERRLEHGLFSPAFLPENLYVATIMPPEAINPQCLFDRDCGILTPSLWGMGLVWTSPLLLAGVFAWRMPQFVPIVVGTGLIMLPSLLYHNTGSAQFGYRFWLDALPLWLLAVAWAVRRWPAYALLPLVGYSLVVNLIGTLWLTRQLVPPTAN